jgi:hypothetical protein
VISFLPGAAPDEPGGALYVPPQGQGRLDDPEHYDVLYLGDTRTGVCAEVFNRGKYRRQWSRDMLRGTPKLPGSARAMAWYEISDRTPICNLDDPNQLVAQSLRPSQVITRDYAVSRTWALRLFRRKRWCGVRWWSYHDARWASFGLWDRGQIKTCGVQPLTLDDPNLAEAARVLDIRLLKSRASS